MCRIRKCVDMTIKFLIVAIITLIAGYSVSAAPISELPTTVTQPNGEEFNLFVSGDEYFNYLHDQNGNIIIQDYETGYYTYAKIENGMVVPTNVALTNNNNTSGAMPIQPSTIIFEDIPTSYIESMYENSPLNENSDAGQGVLRSAAGLVNDREKHPFLYESVNNIVIFIDFPDVTFNSALDADYFNAILNTNDNSLKNWFDTASYGKTELISHLYPTPNGSLLATYTDIYPRTTYQPHHKDNNGNDVYVLNGEVISRMELEHDLLERAVNAVSSKISEELNIDVDEDNCVDSVTFIVAGNSGSWNTLLWSHKWSMGRSAKINGKRVSTYTFVMENEVSPNGRYDSVLQHELFHLYGAPDLYHYTSGYKTSVGRWDNMDASAGQMVCMYLKYKYGNWIDEIPEITDDTKAYTLNKNTLPTNNCYVLRSPYSSNEFFVVEYRKKEAPFEDMIPGSGVVIFRIDSRFSGNSTYNGTTRLDEVFVSHNPPANSARYPYYSDSVSLKLHDGTDAGITLDHFVLADDTASFRVTFTYDKLLGRFMDPRLVNAISEQLNKPAENITEADLQTVTSLTINQIGNYDLSVDLTGIEHLTNLESLILNGCKVKNIDVLSGLTNLECLELKDNDITNINALSNLVNLTHLKLRGNLIDDYMPTSSYYANLTVRDFTIDNASHFVLSVPNYTTDNIGNLMIDYGDGLPDKIHLLVETYSESGVLLEKGFYNNIELTNNSIQYPIPTKFNCQDGAYVVITCFERLDFKQVIGKAIIKPTIFDFSLLN